jgi:hypothetical protein
MDCPIRVLGRQFDHQALGELQTWIDQQPGLSRRRLSVALAERWDWRSQGGQLRDMATRLLLNRLEAQGRLRLPPRELRGGRRSVRVPPASDGPAAQPITGALAALQPVAVRLVPPAHPERRRLVQYLAHHHYLGYPHPLGQLHYLVQDSQGRDVAALLFGPAAWKCQARDAFLGWTAPERQAHLGRLAGNRRFLILPWVVVPHLASHLLGAVLRRLPADWYGHTGQRAVLAESFVEVDRFAGTCYRASNWIDLGLTQGRSRHGRSGLRGPVKRLFVRPLSRHFRQDLVA